MSEHLSYNNKLEGFQGNSKDLTVIIYDSSNNLFDLTDYDGYMYGKKFPIRADSPIDISINYTSKDPSNGAMYFQLSTTNLDIASGDYLYEIIIDDGLTNRHTVIQDKLNLKGSIIV